VTGKDSDVASGKLKYASVLYTYRDYSRVQILLHELERSLESNAGNSVKICTCTIGHTDFNDDSSTHGSKFYLTKFLKTTLHVVYLLYIKTLYHANFCQVVILLHH